MYRSIAVALLLILLGAPCALHASDEAYADLMRGEGVVPTTTDDSALRQVFDALPGDAAGQAQLLTHNAQAWAARWWMLHQAERSIDTTYFILEKDVFGMAFLGHLFKKAREGKAVRLMVDARGTKGLARTGQGQDYMQEIVDTGNGQVRVYSPYYKGILDHVKETGARLIGGEASTAAIACNHDKILVCDDDLGITGGRNISLNYFASAVDNGEVFRDTDVLYRSSSLVERLRSGFEGEFASKNNHVVKGNWPAKLIRRDIELLSVFVMMENWLHADALDAQHCRSLRESEEARKEMAEALLATLPEGLKAIGMNRKPSGWDLRNIRPWAVELAGYPALRGQGSFRPEWVDVQGAKVLDRGSSQGDMSDGIQQALVSLVKASTRSIVIQNPYVVLTELAVETLAEAGRRGVQITIITNSPISTDSALTQAFFIEQWPVYLARIPNLRIKVLTGDRKLHAKVAVFDGVLSLVGTYNLDYMSARVNGEIISAVWSAPFAAKVSESVLSDPAYAKGLFEYRIKYDATGKPVDGDPSTEAIEPVVEAGAKDHIPAELWEKYKKLRKGGQVMQKVLPQLQPLM